MKGFIFSLQWDMSRDFSGQKFRKKIDIPCLGLGSETREWREEMMEVRGAVVLWQFGFYVEGSSFSLFFFGGEEGAENHGFFCIKAFKKKGK